MQNNSPQFSFAWLKYLGVFSVLCCIYCISLFYYHYHDDVFSKALTISQHIKLSVQSIGSLLLDMMIPLLFFTGALVYRKVRINNINPWKAIKRDLFFILPLSILIWVYCAVYDAKVKTTFYDLIYQVQILEDGEELVEDPTMFELMKSPNLNGLYKEIDTLNIRIEDAEYRLKEHSVNIKPMKQYIASIETQKAGYVDEIREIYFTPIYIILFLLFGMLLGYLIPINRFALIAILFAIGCIWLYGMRIPEVLFDINRLNKSWFLLGKILLLAVGNSLLFMLVVSNFKKRNQPPLNEI